jgi:hypothetical protein
MLYFLLPKRLRCGIETAWFPHSPRLCSHNLRVNYCFIYCFTCVIETNPQGFILSTKCFCILLCYSLLTALCQCPKTNYKGLTESIYSNSLRIGSCGYDSLLAAEGMSHNDSQKRILSRLTQSINI